MKKHIIFVCNGNIYRSVIAAQCLRNVVKKKGLRASFVIDSYGLQGTGGTMPPIHRRLVEYPKEWRAARPTLKQYGIDISTHSAKPISLRAIKHAQVVIAMDDKVFSGANNSLKKQFPRYAKKLRRFSALTPRHAPIPDVVGSGDPKRHKKVIGIIYSTVTKRHRDIFTWVTSQT